MHEKFEGHAVLACRKYLVWHPVCITVLTEVKAWPIKQIEAGVDFRAHALRAAGPEVTNGKGKFSPLENRRDRSRGPGTPRIGRQAGIFSASAGTGGSA